MTTKAAAAPKIDSKATKKAGEAVPQVMKQGPVTPWLYLAPALIVMAFFIVYPMLNTAALSLQNEDSTAPASVDCEAGQACWGIFENYRYALFDEVEGSNLIEKWLSFWVSSYGNNIKWILLMVTGTTGLGLLIALLADRVKYEALAKAVFFTPMAISFVGAGIIWKFVYDYGTDQAQVGLLNAIVTAFGGTPVAWLQTQPINTVALIMVGIWMWTGFCMTILSASLKSVPGEILEAARVDGATEWKVFWEIMIPMIMPTIIVVLTVMVINVLKIFDIVYVMTGGQFGTEVIANRMYTEMYINDHTGRGTAVALVLIILLIPFIYINIKRFQEQEAAR